VHEGEGLVARAMKDKEALRVDRGPVDSSDEQERSVAKRATRKISEPLARVSKSGARIAKTGARSVGVKSKEKGHKSRRRS